MAIAPARNGLNRRPGILVKSWGNYGRVVSTDRIRAE
jgi:hypothetical protein